jgi:glucosylceramidase
MVGTAWSAPGWMKEGNNVKTRKGLLGGTLSPNYFDIYANYLSKLVQAYTNIDIPFDAITIQNEPAFSPSNYASMLLNAT